MKMMLLAYWWLSRNTKGNYHELESGELAAYRDELSSVITRLNDLSCTPRSRLDEWIRIFILRRLIKTESDLEILLKFRLIAVGRLRV